MANQQIGNVQGVAALNAVSGQQKSNMNGSTTQSGGFSSTNLNDIGAMRTRLAAIDAGFYTAARLNAMTKNDMVYAIRCNDHAATIK